MPSPRLLRAFSILALPLVAIVSTAERTDAAVVTTCTEPALEAAIAAGGPVTFACSGTIMFTSTKQISGALVIDGNGYDVTLSGGGTTRLFDVYSGRSLTLRNITVSGGRGIDGGAIRVISGGQLQAVGVTFSDNVASSGGAINSNGTVHVSGSTFQGNTSDGAVANFSGSGGGAITNGADGQLVVETSLFQDNSAPLLFEPTPNVRPSAGQGGAIQNTGVASVSRSAFTGNSAFDGGAIYNAALPAVSGSGQLTVVNSTLSGDSATFGGEEILNFSTLTIVNSTLVGRPEAEGAAIGHYPFQFDPAYLLTLTNTILAVRGCVTNAQNHTVDGGGNIVSGAASHGCGIPDTADPQLGPLQDNGGGLPTMAIGTGSPAFGIGIKAACNAPAPAGAAGADQRGRPRFSCSAGAFEPDPAPGSLITRVVPAVAQD